MAGTSGITGRSIKHGSIGAYHLTDSLRKGRYFYESFGVPASIQSFGTQAAPTSIPTLPSALADQVSRIFTGSGNLIEYYQATAQAALPLAHATKGWDIAGDQLANESLEMVFGGNRATNPLAMVVGTDQNFFISATVEFTDADGADQFLVGWRKVENYIVPTSFLTTGDGLYTDFCGIGFASIVANPNPVSVASDVGNGGSTTVSATGFTWADTRKHKLEMWVVGRQARFFINGVQLGGSVSKDAAGGSITAQSTKAVHAYTFTSGLTLVPFLFLRQDTALAESTFLSEVEIGFLADKGADPNAP